MFHQGPFCRVDISMLKQYTNYNLDSLLKMVYMTNFITQVTFISIHPRVTSVWTGSVHVMTRFPVATVTTHFFTLHTIRVIAAF